MNTVRRAAMALALTLATSSIKAEGFRALAKELSAPARGAGIERVAVLPFNGADGSPDSDGLNLSERLTTQVVRAGKVQVVERALLGRLLEEHHLQQTGAVDPAAVKKLGKLLAVDGIVTGSYTEEGGLLRLNARLIHVETGLIVSAGERQVARDWTPARRDSLVIRQPQASAVAPITLPPLPRDENLRDAPAEPACSGDAGGAEVIESGILELKARHWAILLKNGASRRSLEKNMVDTIDDLDLRREFLDRIDAWTAQGGAPALTASQIARVNFLDQQAFWLRRDCASTEEN